MALDATDIAPRIGSEVRLGKEALLSGAHAAEIRELLDRRGVLVFHDIHPSDDDLKAFALTLGEIQGGSTYDNGIFKVTFDETQNPLGAKYLEGTLGWHIDRTDVDVPPLGSMLTPRVMPPEGGDTEFANTYAAFEDLPEDEQRKLEKLTVIHMVEAQHRNLARREGHVYDAPPSGHDPKPHPLVWGHRSGRKSLFLGLTADHVVGMDPDESQALLDRLMDWSERPEYTYRHKWREGDLVLWDNTGTMHRVHPFDRASGRRMHRVTLEGVESVRPVETAGA